MHLELETGAGICNDFIANARTKLYSRKLYNDYNNVLNSALEKLTFEQRSSENKRTALY